MTSVAMPIKRQEKMKSKSNNREIRSFAGGVPEAGEGRTVFGYAAVFDEDSEVLSDFFEGTFVERIERGAFDGVIEQSDVLALLNHDVSRGVLARSREGVGTLSLSVDERGLRYEFIAPNTALGDELLESIKRGDINASSFAFEVEEDSWKQGEVQKRTITKIAKIYDVSPVYTPAYKGTEVSARALEMLNSDKVQEGPKAEKRRSNRSRIYKFKY